MKIRQISIFIENTTGRLADLSRMLADAGINLRAVSIADTMDFGILRMIVDKPDMALGIFKKAGLAARETEVIAVQVPDTPGGLADVLELLKAEKINIEYLYASASPAALHAHTIIIFKLKDLDRGLAILKQNNFNTAFTF